MVLRRTKKANLSQAKQNNQILMSFIRLRNVLGMSGINNDMVFIKWTQVHDEKRNNFAIAFI